MSNNTVLFKEHVLKMSENLCSTKHTIGKLKDKPQTGRKYLYIIFLIKDCFQNISQLNIQLPQLNKETKFQLNSRQMFD